VAEASEPRFGGQARYAPLVPTFSPHTADAHAAIRLAWRAVLGATALLVAFLIGGPLARSWYVGTAIEPRSAEATSIDGIVYLRRQGAREWTTAGSEVTVQPGDTLRTAANARAFVELFDHSTVLVYPSSTLRVLRAEQGLFLPEKSTIVLDLSNGRARIGVAPHADGTTAFFQVRTPHSSVHLTEGSFSADVGGDTTQVRVRRGDATAYALQDTSTPVRSTATAKAGQRLVVRADQEPLGGQPMRADLLVNGRLSSPAGREITGWVQLDLSEREPEGKISLTETPGAVTFTRTGQGHGETLLSQQLDTDLWDFERVVLSADLQVVSHSLSGGGWQGTEFPLMLRVIYRDDTGGKHAWYRGFYTHNEDGYPVVNGDPVEPSSWHHVDIDLLALLPRPWRIERVEVVASGWDYASAVREVHLWTE